MTTDVEVIDRRISDVSGVSFITEVNGQPDVAISEPEETKKEKKKKKPFQLPFWCIYIAYFLALCIVAVALWVTVEIAGVFGPDKARQWLASFFLSLAQSIFVVEPFKV